MKWLVCFLCFCSALSSAEFRFKDRIEKAKSGDFFVLEANKMATLVAVRSLSPTTLLLEEITVPETKKPASWPDWVKAKAPGHTSWSMIEIDLKEGQLLECYSFSRGAWLQLSAKESLFATLLQLPLKPVAPENRRRIGPPPLAGETDHRKLWNPPLVIEGKNAACDAFEATWPQDGTELSGKTITLYFDSAKRFPFPFWIQADTAHASGAMRTVDAGKNLPAVHRALPRRSPEFAGLPQKTQNGLRLFVKSPKYYKEFELFAADATEPKKGLAPLSFSLAPSQTEMLHLDIAQKELESALIPGHRYTWLLIPAGSTDSYIESNQPFLFEK